MTIIAIDDDANRLRPSRRRHTSTARGEKGARLNAQDRWRTDGGNGGEDGRYIANSHARSDEPFGCGRERSDATGDDDRANRKCDADAECDDSDVRFGIGASLERLIPAIEQLDDGRAKRDGNDRRDKESPSH